MTDVPLATMTLRLYLILLSAGELAEVGQKDRRSGWEFEELCSWNGSRFLLFEETHS